MKRLGLFLLPDEMLVHHTPGWREPLLELSDLPKTTTQCPRPGLEPGPLAPGRSALTIKPLRLPHFLPDWLKNYFREIINLRTFLAGDYANRANTHREFRTTSPQFFRKADPKVFVKDRRSIKSSNCSKSFCIQCSIDSPPYASCSFQVRLEKLGPTHSE